MFSLRPGEDADSCDKVEPRHLVGPIEQSEQHRQWANDPLVSSTYLSTPFLALANVCAFPQFQ